MDPVTKIKWMDEEYDCSLSIESCDRIEDELGSSLEDVFRKMQIDNVVIRRVVALIVREGLSFAGVDADVRTFLHRKNIGNFADLSAASCDLLWNALFDDITNPDPDAEVEESGEE